MNKRIGTIIFDWDGTLHKTERLYITAVRKEYERLIASGAASPRELTDLEIKRYLGMSAPDMWNLFMPMLSEEQKLESARHVGAGMDEALRTRNAVLFDGAADVLETLKESGRSLVFLSNCTHTYLEESRDCFGLDRYFDLLIASEDYDYIPKEAIFASVIRTQPDRFPGDWVMIGDRASDLKVAEASGGPCIGCAYGYGKPEELAAATLLAHDVREIPTLIEQLEKEWYR